MDEKWHAFGWHVVKVDGHDIPSLRKAFAEAPAVAGKPTLVLATTIKGKGVPFMENQAKWHHGVPSDEQLALALAALQAEDEGPEVEAGHEARLKA